MPTLDEIDPDFKKNLADSKPSVEAVARHLEAVGCVVVRVPIQVRPDNCDAQERAEYGLDPDLLAIRGGVSQRVEVKRTGLSFTGKGDFPFPLVIFEETQRWDRMSPKPMFYMVVNKALTTALRVGLDTELGWFRRRRWVERNGRFKDFYECPLSATQVVRLRG